MWLSLQQEMNTSSKVKEMWEITKNAVGKIHLVDSVQRKYSQLW
jgi:hypothetical protein